MTDARRTAELLLDALVRMPAGESVELDQLTDLLLENGVAKHLLDAVVGHFSSRACHVLDEFRPCLYLEGAWRYGLLRRLENDR